jgi:ABC-type lipoprotein release transport system permease subunit
MVTLTVPILLSLLVGGLASYRPAMTAAQIAPAEALRNE